MKTSCIQHPAKNPYINIHQWQIEACDGSVCAAALLSYFEFRHNWKVDQAYKARQYNDTAEKHGDPRTQDESLYIWDTADELARHTLIYSAKSMPAGLKILEEKGFISIHRNPNDRYAFDKTKFFLFHPDKVNEWIQSSQEKQLDRTGKNGRSTPKTRRPSPEKGKPSPEKGKPSPEKGRAITNKSSINSSTKSSTKSSINPNDMDPPDGDHDSGIHQDAHIVPEPSYPQQHRTSSLPTPQIEPVSAGLSVPQQPHQKQTDQWIPDFWQRVKDVYNDNKPDLWASLQSLNDARRKALGKVRKECGDDRTLAQLRDALRFASQDPFWGTKAMGVDNLLRQGRIVEFAEKWAVVESSGSLVKMLEDPSQREALARRQRMKQGLMQFYGEANNA